MDTSFCGFLEVASSSYVFFETWEKRWVAFYGASVTIFFDESESEIIEVILVTNQSKVCVLPPEASKQNIFVVSEPNSSTSHKFCAPNVVSLEAWMIVFIQLINGEIRPSENFCTENNSMPVKIKISLKGDADVTVNPNQVELSEFSTCFGYLRRFKDGEWYRNYFVLDKSILTYFDNKFLTQDPANLNGRCIIDRKTRLILLPPDFQGQIHTFAIVVKNMHTKRFVSMRLSTDDESIMHKWITSLQTDIAINRTYRNMRRRSNESTESLSDVDEEMIYASTLLHPETMEQLSNDVGNNNLVDSSDDEEKDYLDNILSKLASKASSTGDLILDSINQYVVNPTTSNVLSFFGGGRQSKGEILSQEIEENERFREFYKKHFTLTYLGSDDIEVVVYENQRFVPMVGWSKTELSSANGIEFPYKSLVKSKPPPGYQWYVHIRNSLFFPPDIRHAPPPAESEGTRSDAQDNNNRSEVDGMKSNIGKEYNGEEQCLQHVVDGEGEGGGEDDLEYVVIPPGVRENRNEPHRLGKYQWAVDTSYTNTDSHGWTYAMSFRRFKRHLVKGRSHNFPKMHDTVRRRRWLRVATPYWPHASTDSQTGVVFKGGMDV